METLHRGSEIPAGIMGAEKHIYHCEYDLKVRDTRRIIRA